MIRKDRNYAFIDGQNLNMGIRELGWNLDWSRFRTYLRETYSVTKAYFFVGYIESNLKMYEQLKKQGYTLCFKKIIENKDGSVKGNVDAQMVFQAMLDLPSYNRAVIVSSDGDFDCLAEYLYKKRKLAALISPHTRLCSILLKKAAKEKVRFLDSLKTKLAYKK